MSTRLSAEELEVRERQPDTFDVFELIAEIRASWAESAQWRTEARQMANETIPKMAQQAMDAVAAARAESVRLREALRDAEFIVSKMLAANTPTAKRRKDAFLDAARALLESETPQ